MTEDTKIRIIEDIEDMTRLAEEYSAATSEILTTDIDETLEELVDRRGEITDRIGEKRRDIDKAREDCTPEESSLIQKMIVGAHVPLGMSADLRAINKAAVKMHSVYLSVSNKEKQAEARVDARIKELRTELENVTSDHKKVKSYSQFSTGIGSNSGSSFNGRM